MIKLKNEKIIINLYKYSILCIFIFVLFFSLNYAVHSQSYVTKNYICSDGGTLSYDEGKTGDNNTPCKDRVDETLCTNTPYFRDNDIVICEWKDTGITSIACLPKVSLEGYCPNGIITTETETTAPNCSFYKCNINTSSNLLTNNALEITDTGARLQGSLNPRGIETDVYFRYSPLEKPPIFCNDLYGSRMKATNEVVVSGKTPLTVSSTVAGLLPNTTYYYCIVNSTNEKLPTYGGVQSFTTNITPSTSNSNKNLSITTNRAFVVNSTSAYLNGSYNSTPSSDTTETYFLLKKGSVWQTQKLDLKQHVSGKAGNISYLLTGLSPNTNYQFKAVIKRSSITIHGSVSTFTTDSNNILNGGTIGVGVGYTNSCTNTNSDINCNGTSGLNIEVGMETEIETVETNIENPSNLVLGQIATPPSDAIVRYHEGIETVFTRQIIANPELARTYGYKEGANLQTFAWNLSDLLAKTFGYVNSSGKEIRVSEPDIAAYQLYVVNGILTVYEYYDSRIVNIQKITDVLRNKYYYEYYFQK
ncbi:MAG: hypothetical protein WCT77_13940 [Bacteroidota bacterium]